MEYIWLARIGFVIFSIGIDFIHFDNLYLRVCPVARPVLPLENRYEITNYIIILCLGYS